MGYLIGLDVGNTMVKAALFDELGRQLAVQTSHGSTHQPRPGHVERSLDELWNGAAGAIGACIDKAGVDPSHVRAVGCTGHGNGLYLVDREGAPLLGVQSIDTRAIATAGRLNAEGRGERLRRLNLQTPWPAQSPTLLAWIREHDPETFARVGTVLLCKDFATYCLTGRLGSDYSDMSGAGFLNVTERRYDEAILAEYGLADCQALLPALAEPSDIVGHVTAEAAARTGLREGTPVVAGLFDVVASALGSGTARVGEASVVAGTWSINQAILDHPIADDPPFMSSAYEPQRCMAIECSATSAGNLEWFAGQFLAGESAAMGESSPFELWNRLVADVTPARDLPIYHPFLYGSSTQSDARAGLYGITGAHGREHILYALYEGVAFEHRRHIERLREAGGVFHRVRLCGGGSRSPVLSQLLCDVLEVPIEVASAEETGALGAAMAAGVGVGLFGSLGDAAERMTCVERHYEPQERYRDTLHDRYRRYLALCQVMAEAWREMSRVQ